MENGKHSTAILVLSCDKYADIWPTFFSFFYKYWSNCPFPVYLGTNEKKLDDPRVTTLLSNRKTTWSDELAAILKQIKEERVLIILEDYFIYEQVNNDDIFKCIDVLNANNAAYMKLGCFPKQYDSLWPHTPLEHAPGFAAIKKGSQYRLCLQTALWNKNSLLHLLDPSESPWQFEIEASKRSNAMEEPFLCVVSDPQKKYVHGPITYYCTALSAGKWMRGAIRLCKKNNITPDLSHLPVESKWEEIKRYIYIASPLKVRKALNFAASRLFK